MRSASAKKRIWGWYAFDWASQPYYTLCLTFIFGPYFASVVTENLMLQGIDEETADARAQSLWSIGQTAAGLLIAFTAPFLGALADNAGRRMPYIIAFSLFYMAGAWSLWWMLPDGSFVTGALVAFAVGLIGAEYTTIFTNSLLPDLGGSDEIGKISGFGYALGYAGGFLALLVMLLLLAEQPNGKTLIGLDPLFGLDAGAREGTRAVGPLAALWYLVFMIPFFLWVREPVPRDPTPGVAAALRSLGETLRKVPGRKSLFAYLASSMFYRDALNALYGFGGTYAALVLDWSITSVGVFGIVGIIAAGLATWAGGHIDSRRGPKPVIQFCILVLIVVCLTILGMSRDSLFGLPLAEGSPVPDITFYICGALIGAAGGVLQASSRTMMVRHADEDRPTEAFGLYALSGKATAFLGPMLIGSATYLFNSARLGVSPLIALFVLGLVLLLWVKPEGERAV